MLDLEKYFCINPQCKYFGLKNQNNISTRGSFGREYDRILLYCRSCKKRFVPSHATAFHKIHIAPDKIREIIQYTAEGLSIRSIASTLKLSKDTVHRVILFTEEHCAHIVGDLLQSINLKEDELQTLMKFFEKRKISKKVVELSPGRLTQKNSE